MGADIKQLRTRIKSVDSTLHLTKAMGLVASSKIRRAAEASACGKDFADAVTALAADLASRVRNNPFAEKRQTERTRIIVMAGDRGLAGGYNANVFRLAKTLGDVTFIPIGKRACERFADPAQPTEKVALEAYPALAAKQLAERQCEDFLNGRFDRLGILYTQFHSMLQQTATISWVLPFESGAPSTGSILFEPDEETMLKEIFPTYVTAVIVGTARESFLSEVAARRVAMDSAGKNATQMMDDLTLAYNRARQGSITQEITEIVAGSGLQ